MDSKSSHILGSVGAARSSDDQYPNKSRYVAMRGENVRGNRDSGRCNNPAKDRGSSASALTLTGDKGLLELDLDYLERRGDETVVGGENADSGTREEEEEEEEDSPADNLDRVKVVFLGAPGVGKSSIIRQFVWNEFSEEYRPTESRETYYPSVVLADRLYELKITDLPSIPYFPVSSHLEWTDFRYYGLRTATAYVLVFDLSNQEDTFQYVRALREQMYEARDMRGVPILVVGNKQDRSSPAVASSARYRDTVNLVRKHWRCGYVECSAKFNCRVVQVFRELMRGIQTAEGGSSFASPTAGQPLGSSPRDSANERCVLL